MTAPSLEHLPETMGLRERDLPILWLELDAGGLVTGCNPFTRRLCAEEPVGRSLQALLVEAQRPAVEALLADAAAGRTQLAFATPDRTPRSLVVAAVRVPGGLLLVGAEDRSETARVEEVLAVSHRALAGAARRLQKSNAELGREGAARSRALEATTGRLRAAEGWLQGVAGQVGAGLWEWDLLANRTVFSGEWLRLHGLPADLSIFEGAAFARHVAPEVAAAMEAALRSARLGSATEVRLEYAVDGPGGARRHLRSVATVERSGEGRPLRLRGVCLEAPAGTPR